MNPKFQEKYFLLMQLSVLAAIAGALWLILRPRRSDDSQFRVREADTRKPGQPNTPGADDALANAKMKRHEPLRLEGIRIDGTAYEILGLRPGARTAEIQKAYRDLMKRYHPDLVGRPGSREWKDAQKIAEALNRAKDELLKQH